MASKSAYSNVAYVQDERTGTSSYTTSLATSGEAVYGGNPVRMTSPCHTEQGDRYDVIDDQRSLATYGGRVADDIVHAAPPYDALGQLQNTETTSDSPDGAATSLTAGSRIVVDVPDSDSHLHLHLYLHYDKDKDVPRINISAYDTQPYVNDFDGRPSLQHDVEGGSESDSSTVSNTFSTAERKGKQSPFQTVDHRTLGSTALGDFCIQETAVAPDMGGPGIRKQEPPAIQGAPRAIVPLEQASIDAPRAIVPLEQASIDAPRAIVPLEQASIDDTCVRSTFFPPDVSGPAAYWKQPQPEADAESLEEDQSPKSTYSHCSTDTVIHVKEDIPEALVGQPPSAPQEHCQGPSPGDQRQPGWKADVPAEQTRTTFLESRTHDEDDKSANDPGTGLGAPKAEGIPAIYVSQFSEDTDALLDRKRSSPVYDNELQGQINLCSVQEEPGSSAMVKLTGSQAGLAILSPTQELQANQSYHGNARVSTGQQVVEVKPKASSRVVFAAQQAVAILPEKLEEPDDSGHSRAVCYLIWAALSCVFCFWPLGTPAIAFASLAVAAAGRGQYHKARQMEWVAMWLTVATMIVGVFVFIVVIWFIILPRSYL